MRFADGASLTRPATSQPYSRPLTSPRRPMSARGPIILETHRVITTAGAGPPKLLSRDVRYHDSAQQGVFVSPRRPTGSDDPRFNFHRAATPALLGGGISPRSPRRPIPAGSWRAYGPISVETEYSRSFQYRDPVSAHSNHLGLFAGASLQAHVAHL